jgi:Holliday junction resolvase RusA-like endonuclease
MPGRSLEFKVDGLPVPQGSTKSFIVKGKGGAKDRVATTHANKGTEAWRADIRLAAKARNEEVFEGDRFYVPKDKKGISDGVNITVTFFFPRPKGKPKGRMTTRPDIDKLIRAVLDALTSVLFEDDSQVDEMTIIKSYQAEGYAPGAIIRVEMQ